MLTSLPYFIGFSQNDSIQEIEKGIWLEPVAPKFPGGGKRMKSFIQLVKHFPDSAKAKEIEGKVYVQFLVGKTGELSNFNILRSPDSSLSQEAIRIMKLMPDFIPGTNHNGDSVKVRMVMPIDFKINLENENSYYVKEPVFPGGENAFFSYLSKKLIFTQPISDNYIFKYYFKFVIEKDGSISNLKMLKNYNEELYRQVILIFLDMPNWKPATFKEKPVRSQMAIPIRFHPR